MSADWGHDQARLATLRCEIAAYATRCHEPVAPPCGDRAEWYTDDLVWLCERHQRQLATDDIDIASHEIER